ncbi:hypothetical protein Tco_0590837 [Tanacetum coccineum]
MNVDSDTFPSTGEDWAQDDLFANTTFATFQQAEPLDPIVQPNDGFSGHPNDHDPVNDVVSSSSLFIDLIQNDSSDPDNSKKEQSDANNWFQDSLWAIGASSSTTNVVASKDDDDRFTSSL